MHPALTQQINGSFPGHQSRALRGLAGTQYAILSAITPIDITKSLTLFSLPVNGGIWYHVQIVLNLELGWAATLSFDVGGTAEVELLSGSSITRTGTSITAIGYATQSIGTVSVPINNVAAIQASVDLMVKFYEPGLAGMFDVGSNNASSANIQAGSYIAITPTVPLFDK